MTTINPALFRSQLKANWQISKHYPNIFIEQELLCLMYYYQLACSLFALYSKYLLVAAMQLYSINIGIIFISIIILSFSVIIPKPPWYQGGWILSNYTSAQQYQDLLNVIWMFYYFFDMHDLNESLFLTFSILSVRLLALVPLTVIFLFITTHALL